MLPATGEKDAPLAQDGQQLFHLRTALDEAQQSQRLST